MIACCFTFNGGGPDVPNQRLATLPVTFLLAIGFLVLCVTARDAHVIGPAFEKRSVCKHPVVEFCLDAGFVIFSRGCLRCCARFSATRSDVGSMLIFVFGRTVFSAFVRVKRSGNDFSGSGVAACRAGLCSAGSTVRHGNLHTFNVQWYRFGGIVWKFGIWRRLTLEILFVDSYVAEIMTRMGADDWTRSCMAVRKIAAAEVAGIGRILTRQYT